MASFRRPVLLLILVSLVSLVCAAASPTPNLHRRQFQECKDCPIMVAIPGGHFVMGSPKSEPGHFDNEGPQHVVTVKAFALG